MNTLLHQRYHLISHLGSGNAANVYLAHDVQRHSMPVVLKTPVFHQEIRLHKKVSGMAHVPRYLGHFSVPEQQNQSYLVMQYIEGVTLERYQRSLQTLPLDHFFSLGTQLLTTLQAFVDQRVIFHDLHAENVLIEHSGTLFLVDLGQATELTSETQEDVQQDLMRAISLFSDLACFVERHSPFHRPLSALLQEACHTALLQYPSSPSQVLAWWNALSASCNQWRKVHV